MYLSCILVDVGKDPDRPRPGRLWLRNLHHVHQRLCMAFPSEFRLSADAEFLKPFQPGDFGDKQVHVPRGPEAGFLFRIDPQPGGQVVILIQSAVKPNWDYAFHNADYLFAAPPALRVFEPHFSKDEQLRFRLLANPTRKIGTKSGPDGQRNNGKRVSVASDQLVEWLVGRATLAGFLVERESTTVQSGYIYVKREREGSGQHLRSVRFEGVLTITDPASFQETLVRGIGSGKAFGFGLLSVVPVDPSRTGDAT